MKKYFILFLFLFSNILLFAQSFTTIPGTDGLSKATVYQIWTKDHLMELRDSVYNSYYPNYSTWHNGKHFRLMNDINNVTESIHATFKGHFHGSGKKITLEIYNTPNNPNSALFGVISNNGTVDSLIIDGFVDGGCGGITAGILYGSVTNCINNATIISMYGAAMIYQNEGTIINCINNGDITGVDRIGGIAGENGGQIINCINTGKITATASGDNSIFSGVGGICGTVANGCKGILNCLNLGNVSGQGFVGGIVGLANGKPMSPTPITNCVNYGYVKGINNVGGILGYMFYPYVNISNCVNAGVVVGSSDVGSITGKE